MVRHILMVERTKFAYELNVKFEREKRFKKGSTFFFFPEQKECNCPLGGRLCGVDLEKKIESLFMDMLSLRYLLSIQVEMLKMQVNMSLELRKDVKDGDKYQEVINE